MAAIHELHDELEALNRERETVAAEQRQRALEMAQRRNALYAAAIAKRDSITVGMIDPETGQVVHGAIDHRTGRMVVLVNPRLLDADTLAVLEHMGTPVPPITDLYPEGVTIPDRKGK